MNTTEAHEIADYMIARAKAREQRALARFARDFAAIVLAEEQAEAAARAEREREHAAHVASVQPTGVAHSAASLEAILGTAYLS